MRSLAQILLHNKLPFPSVLPTALLTPLLQMSSHPPRPRQMPFKAMAPQPAGASLPASHSGNAPQGLTPLPAATATAPDSAAGTAPRRSMLDGLSAEEQERRRAAIGSSGAGGAGRGGAGKSGPVANSRSLSKPERKARREQWETDVVEVVATHEATVKTLVEKYPEKKEGDIRKLLTHASTLKSSRQLTIYNAMLHDLCLKSKEESSTGKGKSSIQITQELGAETIREMIENLEEHERTELLEQLAEYRTTQRHGVRKSNKAQAADLDALFMRTGTGAMMFAVRSDTHDPNEPTFIETGGSRGFLKDYFDKSYQEIGHNYEMWSVAKGRGESKSNSMVAVRSEINKEVHTKLRVVTGKKDAKMSWANYEVDICEAHKVKMVGWLVTQTDADGNVSVKMSPLNQLPAEIARQTLKGLKNGTIFFVKMSKAEHSALVAKHDALRAANGPLKKRAQRSDFSKTHASHKRKAGKDEDEENDEDDQDGSDEEGSVEQRAQKKRRTSGDTDKPNAPIATNAPHAPSPSHANAPSTMNVPNVPNLPHAPKAPNPPHPSLPNTSNAPNPQNAPHQPNTSNARSREKKKVTKQKKAKSAPAARLTPRQRGKNPSALPATSAPATSTSAAGESAPNLTLRLPSPDPPHGRRTADVCDGVNGVWLRPFLGGPGSMPEMEFDQDLMSLLGEAVGGAHFWDGGAGAAPTSVQGPPLQPLNGYNWALPPNPTPTTSSAHKHGHTSMPEMRGENAPPRAAGAAASISASGPSPAPYLMTRFRLGSA
ncbi:hypothetical protein MSAN_02042000 [Mycena sanguinolenta]|uniref:Uncharacterized protein n=1 Tax=Mycena sanguinolenta TaxID=230812 RepID=A0A8H6XJM2_9AGAR|nr:hypothetical protein MSAN_02042000 [Mycena sanguinolenta]